jgi:hypothetical protein
MEKPCVPDAGGTTSLVVTVAVANGQRNDMNAIARSDDATGIAHPVVRTACAGGISIPSSVAEGLMAITGHVADARNARMSRNDCVLKVMERV